MMDPESTETRRNASNDPGSDAAFATTRWTMVVETKDPDSALAQRALEDLCRSYWRPVYAFVRRCGHASHAAQDLTQEFFAGFLSRDGLRQADPSRGRFRSFLLGSVKNFLANQREKAGTLKRGGHVRFVSLESDSDSTHFGVEPTSGTTPEHAFDRQWALAVLDSVLVRLCREHAEAGKAESFDVLKGTLTEARSEVPYSILATRLGTSEGAVKVQVHRLRQRYRAVLREEIRSTLEDPAKVEEELQVLFAALSNP